MNEYRSVLSAHAFLGNMKAEHLDKIAECASYIEFPQGQYVFRQGERAEHFYLILEGSVEVELFSAAGGPVVLQKVGRGSVLGWSWIIPPYLWRFDARVLQPLKTLEIDAARLRGMMAKDSGLGYEILNRFIHTVCERLESERMRLVELYASHS
jgi:CRP/FNR family transcriptional regulator, cyclic AMP receptor protein